MTLPEVLKAEIRKLVSPLKKEEELIEILRRRLTKREYKLLNALCEEISLDERSRSVNLDPESCEVLHRKLTKKLNREKLKQELMV